MRLRRALAEYALAKEVALGYARLVAWGGHPELRTEAERARRTVAAARQRVRTARYALARRRRQRGLPLDDIV